ncbi:MAG: SDR family oxidoreductase [Pseudomonadota bacterium]|nr:SDR family oxidoreductase [Pseudomonadota bacterium]
MRILILGGDGMLGHQLLRQFHRNHEVRVTLRQDAWTYADYGLFHPDNACFGVDVRSTERLAEVFAEFRPEAVINAVGIIKQRSIAKESIPSLEINALLPHRLAVLCRMGAARLIHLSTDCVFSGSKGGYTVEDIADAIDLYGRTKFLGEVHDDHCVTLRTSIIGLELARKKSLIEWYLAQQGTIKGFVRAIYTGLTTMEMARIIENVLTRHTDLSGVWQVASQPISKYDLLCRLTGKLQRNDIRIIPDEQFVCDRSLDGTRFAQRTGYIAPDWDAMLDELADRIRQRKA